MMGLLGRGTGSGIVSLALEGKQENRKNKCLIVFSALFLITGCFYFLFLLED